MKKAPFDYDKAKQGQPVVTYHGYPARIICWNRQDYYPIVALVTLPSKKEDIQCFKADGTAGDSSTRLFMKQATPKGFIKNCSSKVCGTCKHNRRPSPTRLLCHRLKNQFEVEHWDTCKEWEG